MPHISCLGPKIPPKEVNLQKYSFVSHAEGKVFSFYFCFQASLEYAELDHGLKKGPRKLSWGMTARDTW